MKQTKMRILSLLLALVMCLGMLPAAVLAEEGENPDGEPGTGTVEPGGTGSESTDPGETPDTKTVFTITFNADGGTVSPDSVETDENGILTGLPTPTREGYTFKGWFSGAGQVQENYKFTADATLTARWEEDTPVVTEFVITFDPAGGTVDPSSAKTSADGKLTVLPTPVKSGYTFQGWFRTGSNTPVQPNEVFTAPETITARWEETAKPVRVNFLPNGGKITRLEGNTVPTLTAGNPPVYFGDGSGKIGIDSNSGIGWTVTNGDGRLNSLPTAERDGFTFDGWYIVTGPAANQAWDSKLTDYTGLTKASLSTVFTDGGELAAKWTNAAAITITFKINAPNMTDPDPVKVAKDSPLTSLPKAPARTGYTFLGWYSGTISGGELKNPVKWSVGDKVTADLTLYALWQSSGEDTYDFSNSSRYIDNYKITDKYFDYLTQNENPSWKYNMWKDFYEFYDPTTKDDWGGSCFGMSAVYCMARGSAMDLSVFQSGASTLRELKTPRQSANIQDLINYYMMAQSTTAGVKGKLTYWDRELTDRYSRIVSGLTSERGFSVLGFNFSEGGHAIVARSIQKGSDGNYHVEIWDPNYPDNLGELVISSDYTTARFASGTSGASSYNVDTELKYIMPLSTRSRTYDSNNLQSVFGRSASSSSRSSNAGLVLLSSSVGDFTVTASNGRRAVVKNGKQISGDLTLLEGALDGGPGGAYRFYIQAANLGEVTITLNGKSSDVRLVSDDILAEVSSDALDSVVIGEDRIVTSCASAAQQKVTLASEALGATWNAVTVTGKDTGLTLDASGKALKVSSQNGVSVQVQGENIDSRKTSSKQTVTASSAGTSLTMNSLGFAAQQPDNPFTDVTAGAYYYDAVLWAAANNITGGTSATTFSPNDPCTRAQIVTFLWRAAGSPKPVFGVTPFTDVQAGTYYYDAVLWAVEKGITGGTSATTFSPNDPCTRGQTVSFLWRAAGAPKTVGDLTPFTDVVPGAYYAGAVQWAVEKRITSGLSATSFGPNATVTRGQTVTFLYRSQGK